MKSIILAVRDKGTLIPVMATMLSNNSGEEECEDKLLSRAGYGEYGSCLLTMLESGKSTNDPFKWDEYCRTMNEAHIYIQKHYYNLNSGDVIDVEYILGESNIKKRSEVNV